MSYKKALGFETTHANLKSTLHNRDSSLNHQAVKVADGKTAANQQEFLDKHKIGPNRVKRERIDKVIENTYSAE